MKLFRQGDILFEVVRSLGKGELKIIADGVVARGEVTGHRHRIADLTAADLVEVEVGEMFIRVTSPDGVWIIHEEHKPVVLPAGNYRVRRQREYAPEAIRNVQD